MKTVLLVVLLVLYCSASDKRGVGCDTGCSANTITQMKAGWWYNWGAQPHFSSQVQFIPMIFSINKIGDLPNYSVHLLGFNEANLEGLSVDQAAAVWPQLVAKAGTIASPSQSGNPSYDGSWLLNFINHPSKPKVNYIAVHSYGAHTGQSFIDSITKIYQKFNKPLWITEFAPQDNADSSSNPFPQSQVNEYIDVVIPWLEKTDFVHRYAWHSASRGTSALWDASGQPTETGRRYASKG